MYYVTPAYTPCPIPVYCDMETDDGGWLVLQRRQDGRENFNRCVNTCHKHGDDTKHLVRVYRNWTDYKVGFGDLFGEFWLGNDNMFLLTNQASYKLRIDLWDFNSTHRYAQYMYFAIGGERDRYRLNVQGFSGDIPDGFSYHNGRYFR